MTDVSTDTSADVGGIVYKTTAEKTNYALGKTYELSRDPLDYDGAKYQYLGQREENYTWCDFDFKKMTDGVVGDITAPDYASEPFAVSGITVMLSGTNRTFEYIIDLGDHYEDIDSFVFRNVRNSVPNGGNCGFKIRQAYVSDDNVNFTKVTGTTTNAPVEAAPEIESSTDKNVSNVEHFDYTFKLDSKAKGRYVRILLYSENAYVIQLEEIEVWNK